MISKTECLEIVRALAPHPKPTVEIPLDDALGRILSQSAVAERDQPAFERSSVDGWAVRATDAATPGTSFRVVGRVMAGESPKGTLGPGETMKVMTGAPLPEGADAVVMVERSVEEQGGATVCLTEATRAGANVAHQGEDLRAGDVVLRKGTMIDASATGILAMSGVDPVRVFGLPTICVIPTGDELVPSEGPEPRGPMIRDSNGPMLAAQVRMVSQALVAFRPGIARDSRESLDRFLSIGLQHDVLLLSGGVSMGDLDLVGRLLKDRGLRVHVEKVAIKPGKPLLVGEISLGDHRTFVFGLPGNPVSSFVTFELFVRPFLLRFLGLADERPDEIPVLLGSSTALKQLPREQHLPAVLSELDGERMAIPLAWNGSGDLRAFADAEVLIIIETGTGVVTPGSRVRAHLLPLRAPKALHRFRDRTS